MSDSEKVISELIEQNRNKDEYIRKLEEKISYMEKYIAEIEKENERKNELYRNISDTKNEFERLKQNWSDKFLLLEKKFIRLKEQKDNKERLEDPKIDKCISNINNLMSALNK